MPAMAATHVASSALKFSNFQGLRVGSSKNSDSGVESLRLAPHGVEYRSSSGAIQAVATVSVANSARGRYRYHLRTSEIAVPEYLPIKARVFLQVLDSMSYCFHIATTPSVRWAAHIF